MRLPHFSWTFFSSQGKSGSMRCSLVIDMPNIYSLVIDMPNMYSLVIDMPNIYKVIMTAAAIQSGLNKDTIVSAISDVMMICQTRAESKKYCRDHPELLPQPAKVIMIQSQAELTSSSVDTDSSPLPSLVSTPLWSANASATNYNDSSGESMGRDRVGRHELLDYRSTYIRVH